MIQNPLNTVIEEENQLLREVCCLIKEKVAFSRWSEKIKAAFIEAFYQSEHRLSVMEYRKQLSGRQRLGLPDHPAVDVSSTRLAERFRADVPSGFGLGAGRYLKYEGI